MSYRVLKKRPTSAHKLENGSYENLYEISFRGKKIRVNSAQKQKIEDAYIDLNNPEVGSVRQRRKWAKEFEREILSEVSARQQVKLASFLSRMPHVVSGMLSKGIESNYFGSQIKSALEEIVAITYQMNDWEREQFFKDYSDLFADLADYYNLLNRYSFTAGKEFALTDSELERLHQKGYSSFSQYKKDMEKNVRYVRDVLRKDYKQYYKNYKEGKIDLFESFE